MDMNWIGILAGAIIYMVVSWIWYMPQVFGKEFCALAKVTCECKIEEMWKKLIGAFIGALIMAWVLSLVIDYVGAHNFIGGAVVGFLMWLGFAATIHFSGVLWENRPWKLFLIHVGNLLVSLVLMGGVIGLLNK